jgi:serine O-acetyltransferase
VRQQNLTSAAVHFNRAGGTFPRRMGVLRQIVQDIRTFGRGDLRARKMAATMTYDGTQVLILSRLRHAASHHGVALLPGVLRRVQTALYGIEISADARLGEGVLFLHTVGVVIGGDSLIGDRVVFLGGNTIGSLDGKSYPRIGNDVIIGAGARILGRVTIGDGASIGANAVVVSDVPAGATAVGVPAVARSGRAVAIGQSGG